MQKCSPNWSMLFLRLPVCHISIRPSYMLRLTSWWVLRTLLIGHRWCPGATSHYWLMSQDSVGLRPICLELSQCIAQAHMPFNRRTISLWAYNIYLSHFSRLLYHGRTEEVWRFNPRWQNQWTPKNKNRDPSPPVEQFINYIGLGLM